MSVALSIRSPVEPRVFLDGRVVCPCGGDMSRETFFPIHAPNSEKTKDLRVHDVGGPLTTWWRCREDADHITGARPA